MTTLKAHLRLAVLLLMRGISAFPKPVASSTSYFDYPLCAQSSMSSFTMSSGCLDLLCACTTHTYDLILYCCILASCDEADRTTTGQLVISACDSVGVPPSSSTLPASACPTTMGIAPPTGVAGSAQTASAFSGNSASSPKTSSNSSSGSSKGGISTGGIIGIAITAAVLILGLAIIGLLFYRSRQSRAAAAATAANNDKAATADATKREITPPPSHGDVSTPVLKNTAVDTIDEVPPYDELDGKALAARRADAKAAITAGSVPYPGMHRELAGREIHTPTDWRPGGPGDYKQRQFTPAGGSAAVGELSGEATRQTAVGELDGYHWPTGVELDGAVQQRVYEVAGSGVGWQPGWVELPSGLDG